MRPGEWATLASPWEPVAPSARPEHAASLLDAPVGEYAWFGGSIAGAVEAGRLAGVRVRVSLPDGVAELVGDFATLGDVLSALFPESAAVDRGDYVEVVAREEGNVRWTGYGAVASLEAARVAREVYGLEAAEVGDRVVVGGPASAVEEFREWLETEVRDYWLVEVMVVRESLERRIEAGLDVALTGGFSGRVGSENLGDFIAEISGIGTMNAGGLSGGVIYHAALVVAEGQLVTMHSGQVVPITRRQVTELGAVQVVGYSERQLGVTIDVAIRRVGDGAVMRVSPAISSAAVVVAGEPPVFEQSVVDSEVPVIGNDWVVISGLSVSGGDRRIDLIGGAWSTQRREFRVLARATRVYAGVGG